MRPNVIFTPCFLIRFVAVGGRASARQFTPTKGSVGLKPDPRSNKKEGRHSAPLYYSGIIHAPWFSARKNQVSSTESGFSDTESMPSSINHLARSG